MATTKNWLKISKDSRGNHLKDVGFERVETDIGDIEYKYHRFYLGREHSQAVLRFLKIEEIWVTVCKQWQIHRDGPRAAWNDVPLLIAKAVSQGETEVTLDYPAVDPVEALFDRARVEGESQEDWQARQPQTEPLMPDPVAALAWLESIQKLFPQVRLRLPDQERAEQAVAAEAAQRSADAQRIATLAGPASPSPAAKDSDQTLHQALRAFAQHLKATLAAPPSAKKAGEEVQQLIDHTTDMMLSQFRLAEVEGVIHHFEQRPMTKRGTPMRPATIKDYVKRYRSFIKWLHRSEEFAWRRPDDYEVGRVQVRETPAELVARLDPERVEIYRIEELVTLYQYGTPIERLLLLLSLNCAFGNAEVGNLQVAEVFWDYKHPVVKGLAGPFIRKIWNKSTIYGEWQMFPETAAGLRWYLDTQRPESQAGEVFLSENGRPFSEPTSGGNKNSKIANSWIKLHARIVKDFPEFRKLSFNRLRKTAADFVRQLAGGEVAVLFQQHGQTVPTDRLAEVYTIRPWAKVHTAILGVRGQLEAAGMFANVPDPFPIEYIKTHPATSIGTIKRIQKLRAQGFTVAKVAELCGVSERTIRSYSKKKVDQA